MEEQSKTIHELNQIAETEEVENNNITENELTTFKVKAKGYNKNVLLHMQRNGLTVEMKIIVNSDRTVRILYRNVFIMAECQRR
ncbi:Uncharacterised protein [Listeria grayi]|uniref:Uncharacterized protein n=1 Tax=Listeria grayi TaxID=1641 RepID=A0A378MD23_LISGR|nr:hypothetical protein [Listeria grayi]STY44191.1 Uncharacterised protein [Listeria grayi]